MSVTYSGNGADVEIGVTCCFTMSVNVHVSFHDVLVPVTVKYSELSDAACPAVHFGSELYSYYEAVVS